MTATLRPLCKHDPANPKPGCIPCGRWADPGPIGQNYRAAVAGRQGGATHYQRTEATKPLAVGDDFKATLLRLGFVMFEGCSCESLRLHMNKLGPAGCRGKLAELVEAVQTNAKLAKVTRRQKWRAAWRAATRLVIVNPFRPIPGLILRSCRRVERANR